MKAAGFAPGNSAYPNPRAKNRRTSPKFASCRCWRRTGQFRRLGYGGGYYDKYLSGKGKGMRKIGICYDFQLTDGLPSEEHDVLLDALVTDARILVRGTSEVL